MHISSLVWLTVGALMLGVIARVPIPLVTWLVLTLLPICRIPTLYARTGDLFAWLCVAGLVAALAIAAVAPVRNIAQAFTDRVALHADLSK